MIGSRVRIWASFGWVTKTEVFLKFMVDPKGELSAIEASVSYVQLRTYTNNRYMGLLAVQIPMMDLPYLRNRSSELFLCGGFGRSTCCQQRSQAETPIHGPHPYIPEVVIEPYRATREIISELLLKGENAILEALVRRKRSSEPRDARTRTAFSSKQ